MCSLPGVADYGTGKMLPDIPEGGNWQHFLYRSYYTEKRLFRKRIDSRSDD